MGTRESGVTEQYSPRLILDIKLNNIFVFLHIEHFTSHIAHSTFPREVSEKWVQGTHRVAALSNYVLLIITLLAS